MMLKKAEKTCVLRKVIFREKLFHIENKNSINERETIREQLRAIKNCFNLKKALRIYLLRSRTKQMELGG